MQEWIKGRPDIMLTMPLWTWSEMEVLRMALYKDKVGPAQPCFSNMCPISHCDSSQLPPEHGCGQMTHQDRYQ
jgi:hypothetical protein